MELLMDDLAMLRERMRNGGCRGQRFREMVERYVPIDYSESGYDDLDVFVNELLFVGEMPEPTRELDAEMVEYYKTPARLIFEWVERMEFAANDVFYDIGSGLGQVALLVNLLTGIEARGVEIEPAFCAYAQGCAAALGLHDVHFVAADAREVDYSEGTIFFLYTPFRGEIMASVLEQLQKVALSKPIRVIAVGPCTEEVARALPGCSILLPIL
jgi:SAM-dependent methyltransferase